MADAAGVTLVALLRGSDLEIFTQPERITGEASAMRPEKLVMMANQIGTYFASQKGEDAVAGIADHIKKFWDPRMRDEILAPCTIRGRRLAARGAARYRTARAAKKVVLLEINATKVINFA